MKRITLLVILGIIFYSCSTPQKNITLKSGLWRATVTTSGGELPFGLDLAKITDTSYSAFVINGKEKLKFDQGKITGDSIRIPMDLYESEIVAQIQDSLLVGRFTKYGIKKSSTIPFKAKLGENFRFKNNISETSKSQYSGKWATIFTSGQDTSDAIGIFEQSGNEVSGTFLTTTGDYRYLAGNVVNDSLFLSSFDGSHIYLFKAKVDAENKTIKGGFWSGKSGFESWSAVKDDKAELPDADKLTFLKKGYDKVDFTFPDVNGKPVSLSDEKYKGKVTIIQIMGSWCPNCMDETNFLSPWYKKNKDKGVEIIGLAFERSPEFSVSAPKLQKMIKRFDIQYSVLLAGKVDKVEAAKALPMLEKVMGYPTTIFIDRKGKVRKIHTGFSGPGTGKYYEDWERDFEGFLEKLISEKI